MAPIEVFFGAIIFIFMLIGLARGFLKELGVTMVLMFLLFFLSTFNTQLDSGMARALDMGTKVGLVSNRDRMQCLLYLFVIVAATFVSYQGETLGFGGQAPRGGQGIALGALTGLLNGYLVAGSLWYYLDKFDYPIEFLGFTADKLSDLARAILPFLPVDFLGKPLLFGQSLLLYLSMMLLLARVIR